MSIFFEQIKMKYIAQKLSDSPRTRSAKSDESPKVYYNTKAPIKGATTGRKKKNKTNHMTPIQRMGCLHQS